jgi:nitrile hydratase beta subunit
MNTVHDMGGMAGLGAMEPEHDEPVFHAPWEARVLGLTMSLGAQIRWSPDRFRQSQEVIPGADYLRMAYYERWLTAITALALEAGRITASEVESGRADPAAPREIPALRPEMVVPTHRAGAPKVRPLAARPRFAPGALVRARVMNPATHTRLPRYLRGHVGEVVAHHGSHVFPDSNAIFQGENPQHVYTVRFRAADLWGDVANPRDVVCADLWEPYLDHA